MICLLLQSFLIAKKSMPQRVRRDNPKLKNIVPNFHDKLFKNLPRYRQIAYRPKTQKELQRIINRKFDQIKNTQVFLVCLIGRKVLGQRLQSFVNMIKRLIDKMISFHQKRINQRTEFRQAAIKTLNDLRLCCMKVIHVGEQCLPSCLEKLLDSRPSETGIQGRQKIQERKIQTALFYIERTMANLGQAQIDTEGSNGIESDQSRSSQNCAQRNQQDNQLPSNSIEKESEETQMSISEIKQMPIAQNKMMVQIQGENFIDLCFMKSPEDKTLLKVCDLLERKQEEEIKYMLLQNHTTTKSQPANQQADI